MLSDLAEDFSLQSLYPEDDPDETMAITEEALTRVLESNTNAIRSLFREERDAHQAVVATLARPRYGGGDRRESREKKTTHKDEDLTATITIDSPKPSRKQRHSSRRTRSTRTTCLRSSGSSRRNSRSRPASAAP